MYSFRLTGGPNGTPGATSIRNSIRERDLERKRVQGEAACAECRRLRLKCDRKIPCSSCARRGCPSICPNGSLAGGNGSRFVLANTERLHAKIVQMSERIRQVEDALQIAQTVISSSSHPLLSKELLTIKNVTAFPEEPGEKEVRLEDSTEADVYSEFGTLTISDQGETRFFGRSGASVFMAESARCKLFKLISIFDGILKNSAADPIHDKKIAIQSRLPTEIVYLSDAFPFSPSYMPKEQIRLLIESRLPSYERATALAETYLQNVSVFFRPVDREQIMEELIPTFYKKRVPSQTENETGTAVHRLALLIAVFACGAMGDLTKDICNEEGELYRQLARTALSLQSIFEGTSLATVQAVAMIGSYEFFSCSTLTIESAWKMQALSFSLASSIGLHWDPSNWGIDMKYVNRRRSLFWELCKLDALKSLSSGRPPTFRMHEIDCRFPDEAEVNLAKPAGPIFTGWMYKFIKQIVAPIAVKLCSVSAMKYSEIIDWDIRIRGYVSPCSDAAFSDRSPESSSVITFMFSVYKEITLLYIHRNFFVRALRENPVNPMQSRFAPSFLTTYASAIAVLGLMSRESEREHSLLLRHWPMWVHILSSGVVVGSIAANNNPKELVTSARTELDLTISLFDKAPDHAIVHNGLPILLRLRERSRSLAELNAVQTSNGAGPSQNIKTEDIDEALSIIGGSNRVVRRPLRPSEVYLRKSSPPPETINATSSANGNRLEQSGLYSVERLKGNGTSSVTFPPPNLTTVPYPNPTYGDAQQLQSYITAAGTASLLPGTDALPAPPFVREKYASPQSSEDSMLAQTYFSTIDPNVSDDMYTYDQIQPTGAINQDTLAFAGIGDWDMRSLSWAPMDWNSLNIPANFDFEIGHAMEPPGQEVHNTLQEAWNFLLEESHAKHSSIHDSIL